MLVRMLKCKDLSIGSFVESLQSCLCGNVPCTVCICGTGKKCLKKKKKKIYIKKMIELNVICRIDPAPPRTLPSWIIKANPSCLHLHYNVQCLKKSFLWTQLNRKANPFFKDNFLIKQYRKQYAYL